MSTIVATGPLSAATFAADTHAAKYLSTLQRSPDAFAHLLDLLNRPETARRMVAMPAGEPALGGIVELIERDEAIERVITAGPDALRFRQAIGVAVRLRMEQLGWAPAGSKGTVRRSRHFGRAERYRPQTDETRQQRALAALEAVATMGSDAERAETGRELQRALREARRAAGRPF